LATAARHRGRHFEKKLAVDPMIRTYIAAILTMLLLSVGQVMMKMLAGKLPASGGFSALRQEAASLMWLAVLIVVTYLLVTALWLYVLRTLDLGRAFAFSSLAFVFVPLLSYLFFHEKITMGSVVGTVLIVAGIVVSASY
jgi:drug/metabolite transporter (DMT)-like permease